MVASRETCSMRPCKPPAASPCPSVPAWSGALEATGEWFESAFMEVSRRTSMLVMAGPVSKYVPQAVPAHRPHGRRRLPPVQHRKIGRKAADCDPHLYVRQRLMLGAPPSAHLPPWGVVWKD